MMAVEWRSPALRFRLVGTNSPFQKMTMRLPPVVRCVGIGSR
jgi:hypothetical protein